MMRKCWRMVPEERPRFSQLVVTLDKTLQSVAGYVELSMTLENDPVTSDLEGEEEEWAGYEVVEPPDESGMFHHRIEKNPNIVFLFVLCVKFEHCLFRMKMSSSP